MLILRENADCSKYTNSVAEEESPHIIEILPPVCRLVVLSTDINKTSWVFLGVVPVFFLLLFSVCLLHIAQPLPQGPPGHSVTVNVLLGPRLLR